MRIKYVGNAGVIIETEETCIGIDCFSQDDQGIYQDPSPEERDFLFQLIEKGRLNTLIFTHEHSDHFVAKDVKAACERNANVKVLMGKAGIDLLYKENIPHEQLVEITSLQEIMIGDCKVTFLRSQHDGDQFVHVEHVTLLIYIEGKTVVITGDALPSEKLFREIGEWSRDIDLLIAPFPYVGLHSARRAIAKNLDVKAIVAIHEPRPEKDTLGWVASAEKVCNQAKDGLPTAIFSKKQKEWHCL